MSSKIKSSTKCLIYRQILPARRAPLACTCSFIKIVFTIFFWILEKGPCHCDCPSAGFKKTGCVSLYFFLERWCNTCFMFYPEQSNSRTRRQTSADLLKNGQLHSVTHSRISSLLMVFLSTFNLLGVIFTLYEIIDDKTKLSFQVLKTSDATTCCGHKNTMGDNNKKHMCKILSNNNNIL